jgi:hypothetical protein
MSPESIDTEIGRVTIDDEDEQTIVKVDSQILNAIDLCPTRYKYEHVDHMRPLKKAVALQKGAVMHTMEAHRLRAYMSGRAPHDLGNVLDEAILLGRQEASGYDFDVTMMDDEIIPIFQEYALHAAHDGWQVIAVEQPFSKVLYESPELMILYEGIVDAVIKEAGGRDAVVDHKSESRKSHPFSLSNQFQGYSWAFDMPTIVNKIGFQTSLPNKERFRKYWLEYSEAIIAEWKSDAIASVMRAIDWHREGVFRRDRTSCDKYSGCIFKRVCAAEPEIREFKLQAFFYKDKPWDPYTRDDE